MGGPDLRFGMVLALTIGAVVVPNALLSVLANDFVHELGLSRTAVGSLLAVFGGIGAILSPPVGRLCDRLGGGRVIAAACGLTIAGMIVMSVASGYLVLFIATLLCAASNAAGNPATNAMIATGTIRGARGIVVGIKQSGVQAGYFLVGAVIPVVAVAYGWRIAILAALAAPFSAILTISLARKRTTPALPGREPTSVAPVQRRDVTWDSVRPVVYRIAVFSFLMGGASAGLTGFLPLYAFESVGVSKVQAGWSFAVLGLMGMVARLVLARRAEKHGHYLRTLMLLAVWALVGIALIASATRAGPAALYVGAVVAGVSLGGWNAVAMLAAIEIGGVRLVGRASGAILLGFLGGLATTPTLVGWIADVTGGYLLAWWILAAELGVAAASLLRLRSLQPGR